eukprot:727688-Prymnesium_polylepis.1
MPVVTDADIRAALLRGQPVKQRFGEQIVPQEPPPPAGTASAPPPRAAETKEDLDSRVTFELALNQLAENFRLITTISFNGVELCRKPEWIRKLLEVLGKNTTCTELDLSSTGLTDAAVQQLAIALTSPALAPQLKALNLCDNPLSLMSETVLSGLSRLRPELHVSMPGGRVLTDGFVCHKQLVEGLSAWAPDELRVSGKLIAQDVQFFCPAEISGDGNERVLLRPDGTTT